MPFTTPFWRNAQTEQLARILCAWLLFFAIGSAQAQVQTEVTPFRVDRVEEEVLVSAQMVFELPAAVEDALLKSIPMTFVAEAELLRERWYWYDRKSAQCGASDAACLPAFDAPLAPERYLWARCRSKPGVVLEPEL